MVFTFTIPHYSDALTNWQLAPYLGEEKVTGICIIFPHESGLKLILFPESVLGWLFVMYMVFTKK